MKEHLRRISELAVPIHAICRNRYFPDSALSLSGQTEAPLRLVLAGPCPPPVDAIAVSYSLDSQLYTFETKVAETADEGASKTILSLYLPERIIRLERRKSPRVLCSEHEGVEAVLLPSGKQPIVTAALDMGCSGASLLVDDRAAPFTVGDGFPIVLRLPRLGELRLTATVRVRADTGTGRGVRIGVEFVSLSAEEADLIRQYVHLRQLQIRSGQRTSGPTPPSEESIFAIAVKDPLGERQLILCTDDSVGWLEGQEISYEIVSADVIEYLEKDR